MSEQAPSLVEDLDRLRLKVRCAQLYYGLVPGAKGGLRQSDVARRLGVPRAQVVAWLKEAWGRFVEVRLRAPRALVLELPLLERLSPYGVREVRVVADGGLSPEGALDAVGAEAGRCLRAALAPGVRVGLCGGRTALAAVREVIRDEGLPRLFAYPLSAGGSLALSANALVAMLASAGARGSGAFGLWVPPLKTGRGREEIRRFLRRPEVLAVYRAAQRVDLALLGVGATSGVEAERGLQDYLGVPPRASRAIARTEARAFILQQFIDAGGRDFPCALGERNLAVRLAAIRRTARGSAAGPAKEPFVLRRGVIVAAAGLAKAPAVAAAVRGGLATVLVADIPIAEALLEELKP